ncbi:hypothetical protein M5X04_14515 [Paenibacillus alvei]|uniref:HTH cro/C1-type domain-containing protein n=1 Tax=Paenibacillus alvei TaxID=44250 RepID=A0ABT4E9W6_PAEAL|nr:hypothetical protein [Paenibacillus alvei]MCY9530532.1 hypothetical protein [Paenibacillus alvei]
MRYANILYDAIASSNMTYQQIADKCTRKGTKITKSYISKLCTGKLPPASDAVNKVLAEVLSPSSGLYVQLAVAKYKEIVPNDVLEALAAGM